MFWFHTILLSFEFGNLLLVVFGWFLVKILICLFEILKNKLDQKEDIVPCIGEPFFMITKCFIKFFKESNRNR